MTKERLAEIRAQLDKMFEHDPSGSTLFLPMALREVLDACEKVYEQGREDERERLLMGDMALPSEMLWSDRGPTGFPTNPHGEPDGD